MTLGTSKWGLRVTRGRLSRKGRFHDNQPCVFLLVNGKRKP